MYNECRHIFTGGRKCQSPALNDQPFCYFHSNTRKRVPTSEPDITPKEAVLTLPGLDDSHAIQLALSDVILALAANRIDPRRARILIYGLQVASQNLRRAQDTCGPIMPTVGLSGDDIQTVREIHRHEDGTIIGPEKESLDQEEIKERKRPPSLGELLLKDVEEMRARREAGIPEPDLYYDEIERKWRPRQKDEEDDDEEGLHIHAAAETVEGAKHLVVKAPDFSPVRMLKKVVVLKGHDIQSRRKGCKSTRL